MNIHELKESNGNLYDIMTGEKTATLRRADRDFKYQDRIIFRETSTPAGDPNPEYTGREVKTIITHIQKPPSPGLSEDYVHICFVPIAGKGF